MNAGSYPLLVNTSSGKPLAHTVELTLNGLRANLLPLQAAFLNEIWHHFGRSCEWPSLRAMYSRHGKSSVIESLSRLGGSVVWELEATERGKCCELSLIGVLLTTEGPKFERLLVRFFEFQRQLFKTDPEKRNINSGEVATAMALAQEETSLLGQLLWLGHLGGSSKKDGSWIVTAMQEADDFPISGELDACFEQWLLRNYKPDAPVFLNDRQKFLTVPQHISGTLHTQHR